MAPYFFLLAFFKNFCYNIYKKIRKEEKMKILVEKEVLRNLIEENLELTALECGGVDNWSWYSEAIRSFIKMELDNDEILKEHFTAKGMIDDVTIRDLADYYVDCIIENEEEKNAST